jgi:acetone carboxylase gamma subunit
MLTAKSDFDYLSLRKTDSKSFATVSKLLVAQKDQSSDDVFSDTLQVFNNKLELKDEIILITAKNVYTLDMKLNLQRVDSLKDISALLLVKTNPSIF